MQASRGAVVNNAGARIAVLPTWSDASLLAEGLGLGFQAQNLLAGWSTGDADGREVSGASPEMAEHQVATWSDITDATWLAALTRIRGADYAARWDAARMGPHPTYDESVAAVEEFRRWAAARPGAE